MAEQKEYRQFRQILKEGIGNRSQTAFAEEIGIDVATLNRMLNSDFISRPRKKTLQRIAEHITNATLSELYLACEYFDDATRAGAKPVETPHDARIMKNLSQRRVMNIDDLKLGFEEFRSKLACFTSFDELMESVRTLYAQENVVFRVSEEHETTLFNADFYRPVSAVWTYDCDDRKNVTYFVVFYTITRNGLYMLSHVAFDGLTLMKCNAVPQAVVKEQERYGVDARDLPFISCFFNNSEDSEEARLLRAIFGIDVNNPAVSVPSVRSGYGFYIPDGVVPPKCLEFFRNHAGTLKENARKLVGTADKNDDLLKIFKHTGEADDFRRVLADIIEKEIADPDIPCCWWSSEEMPFDTAFNDGCVVIPVDDGCDDTERYEKIKKIMFRYAQELGIPRVQVCHNQYMKEVHEKTDVVVVE